MEDPCTSSHEKKESIAHTRQKVGGFGYIQGGVISNRSLKADLPAHISVRFDVIYLNHSRW